MYKESRYNHRQYIALHCDQIQQLVGEFSQRLKVNCQYAVGLPFTISFQTMEGGNHV